VLDAVFQHAMREIPMANGPTTVYPTIPVLVRKFVQHYTSLWWEIDSRNPPLGPSYTAEEQEAREAHLKRFQSAVIAEAKHAPRTQSERQATQEHILSAFRAFARVALGFDEGHMDVLLERGLPQVGTQFAQTARRFDPTIPGRDIFQAMRNVWTMNCLQLMLGMPIQLTPAAFAYSMLYPYTDNYLDDPSIPEQAKKAFNERFGRRLQGERVSPVDAQEQIIYKLVGMIEDQFERSRYPQVFQSLYAIHFAQCKSVDLLRRNASPYEVDVLGISFEKGGTSVMADGYLVAGSLTEAQAAYMFGWGAFVQLGDDLQDVAQDANDGLLTVFSQTAGRWPLDRVTNRAFHFGQKVLGGLDSFKAASAEPVKQLMRRAVYRLLIEAAGAAGEFYTKGYLRKLERHSAFRFPFLKARRKQMAGQSASLMGLVEAFAKFEDGSVPPPFPLP
jgi:hypothetical protein